MDFTNPSKLFIRGNRSQKNTNLSNMIKIIGVGDIFPGGLLNGKNEAYLSDEVQLFIQSADIRVGTLETAIGNTPSFYEEKMKRRGNVIYSEDKDLLRLQEMHIDVVSLANNHFLDLGPEGAVHAIDLLDQLGILHTGAGRNLQEAAHPAIINKNGETYAFLAFCDNRPETTGWCKFASATDAGINPMDEDYVLAQIRGAKQLYDYVIVMPHWGIEYSIFPTMRVRKLAHKMLQAGADLIMGSHPHCVQPIEKTSRGSIVYSMGNFLFPDRLITPPRSTWYPHKDIDLSALPVTMSYPYVKTPTLKLWKPKARIGMMVVNNGKHVSYRLTHLSDRQCVEMLNKNGLIRLKLKCISTIMSFGLYSPLYYMVQVVRILNFILFKRLLSKK